MLPAIVRTGKLEGFGVEGIRMAWAVFREDHGQEHWRCPCADRELEEKIRFTEEILGGR